MDPKEDYESCSEEESMSESETTTTSDEEFIEENENLKKENHLLKNKLKKQGKIIWEITKDLQESGVLKQSA